MATVLFLVLLSLVAAGHKCLSSEDVSVKNYEDYRYRTMGVNTLRLMEIPSGNTCEYFFDGFDKPDM